MDELFKPLDWPRLIIKAVTFSIICYYSFDYMTHRRAEWDCYATDKKLPNSQAGENMTEKFTQVIFVLFCISLAQCALIALEMINKHARKKAITHFTGMVGILISLCFAAWLVWAIYERMRRNGKICAGATMNVLSEMKPFAYQQGAFLIVIILLMLIVPLALTIATNCGCL